MSLLTNSLLGKRRVTEFTATGGVPTSDGGAAMLNIKPKPQLRPKNPRDKKKLKEGDDDIIPDDAEEVASTDAVMVSTGVSSTGLEPKEGERDGGPRSNPNLLPSSLALVAPDCTPGWDKPLSPMALPKSDRKPAATAPVQAPSEPKAERSASDMMRLTRPGKPAGAGTSGDEPNLEHMARNVAASVVQEDTDNPISIPSGEGLLAQGKPMPDHVQSNSSAGTLKRYNFSGS